MSNQLQCEHKYNEHLRSPIASFMEWLSEALGLILFLLMFVGLPLWTGYRLYMAKSTEGWPTTRGTVIEASFKERMRGARDEPSYTEFIPVVSYQYTIDGTTYTSNRVAYNNLTTINQRELEGFLSPYSPGTTVEVFYSPRDSSCSVLIPGIPGSDEYFREVVGFIGLIVLYIVVFGVLSVLGEVSAEYETDSARGRGGGANDTDTEQSSSSRSNTKRGSDNGTTD